jgi:hypothetical protein
MEICTFFPFSIALKSAMTSVFAAEFVKKCLKVTNEKQAGLEGWQMTDILVPDRGDRCPFLILFGRHLGLILLPFSAHSSTIAQ